MAEIDSIIFPQKATPQSIILDAAQRLILQHGYAGLSMRDLARDSGLAKGTIYYYFEDKEAIYLSVVERDLLNMQARIQEAAQTAGDCAARLQAVINAYFELAQANRSIFIARLREISGMENALRSLLQRHRHALMQPIADIIEEGQASGAFRPVNSEMVIISLFGMMNSFVTHRFLIEQNDITPEVVEHTLDLVLHGIARPDDES
ncbi:MAG: TetR/AcrR family transcriptional regulator [Caldilineaceae bacterium]